MTKKQEIAVGDVEFFRDTKTVSLHTKLSKGALGKRKIVVVPVDEDLNDQKKLQELYADKKEETKK